MLIDRVLADWEIIKPRFNTPLFGGCYMEEVKSFLDCSVAFEITNVYEYIKNKQTIGISDCPNIRPQYKSMWFEYSSSDKCTVINVSGKQETAKINKVGILNYSEFENNEGITASIPFIDIGYKISPLGIMATTWDRFGVLGEKYGGPDISAIVYHETIENQLKELMLITFVAISFMHCKNVSLETIEPSQKLNQSRIKKGKNPLIKYHLININPMKKLLDDAGANSPTGLKRALHICRGHFKDFSDGQGLFGKYQGLYWWEAQVRGNKQNGVMLKDYKVTSAKKGGVNNTPGDMTKKEEKS